MATMRQRGPVTAPTRPRYPPRSSFVYTQLRAGHTSQPPTQDGLRSYHQPQSPLSATSVSASRIATTVSHSGVSTTHSAYLPMNRGELPTCTRIGSRGSHLRSTYIGGHQPRNVLLLIGVACILVGGLYLTALQFSPTWATPPGHHGIGGQIPLPSTASGQHAAAAMAAAGMHDMDTSQHTHGGTSGMYMQHGKERSAAARNAKPQRPMSVTEQRQQKVREMMMSAWGGYRRHAWGANELRPMSKRGHSANIFGKIQGATIVDALDTLILMNMTGEVAVARVWIEQELTFDIDATVSTFEVCIRYLGGLLSAYALTNDELYKLKAAELGDRLLPAFDTNTGIPWSAINLQTGKGTMWSWAPGGCAILSELGTMSLEFEFLTRITGNPIYAEKTRRAVAHATENVPHTGLYPNYIHPQSGQWGPSDVSVGALGDSFYEYLYKSWVFSGKPDNCPMKKAYDNAVSALGPLIRTSQRGNVYIAESRNGTKQHKMGHLACFIGGLFALSAKDTNTPAERINYLNSGEGITETCYRGYANSPTGLGPEEMLFESPTELSSPNSGHRYYILRPEVIESYFYMWRVTKNERYRTWAWEAVLALEKHAKCGWGYCGIKDVHATPPVHDDLQQSFFLAETLKYLYLIFSDDAVLPLDRWVMNTEAHPLPIATPNN
eukprot:m.99648 g.99648  ORF g.99648 m.99648 type:complete len:666 (-) comp10313_c0_seq6:2480-4477(-)